MFPVGERGGQGQFHRAAADAGGGHGVFTYADKDAERIRSRRGGVQRFVVGQDDLGARCVGGRRNEAGGRGVRIGVFPQLKAGRTVAGRKIQCTIEGGEVFWDGAGITRYDICSQHWCIVAVIFPQFDAVGGSVG